MAGTSEMLTADMRQRIHRAWGLWPGDGYAATEAPGIAFSCPAQVGLHIREDLLIIEVVDERNRPVPTGTPGHRVLLTNLVNRSQPLIRYEISDSVTLADGPNPTGRPFGRIAAIEGRSDDILSMPARDGGKIAVNPYRLRAPFAAVLEVRQFSRVRRPWPARVCRIARDGAGRHPRSGTRGADRTAIETHYRRRSR